MNPTDMPTASENHKNIGGGEDGELNSDSVGTLRLCLTKELVFSIVRLQFGAPSKTLAGGPWPHPLPLSIGAGQVQLGVGKVNMCGG